MSVLLHVTYYYVTELHTRPKLHELKLLKKQSGAKIEVIKSVAPFWKDVGYFLDFDEYGSYVDSIEKKCSHNPDECCTEMLKQWLQGKASRKPTWKDLIDILKDCELNTVADELETYQF